ncbi:FAD-dependent oxidoreductase [Acetobacterium paludosum]|uniref:FAD-dependent oxidoreductase n=1 Tax=Acetobacterium paludosum TaxID=52693 RepID=A0A923HU66_9FIRM|nr:NAD(P)/FAD-dependent oxidoreductase [Acetobacterium paludosum]MBC3888683.1 FAD-dependent oxidoreductase [Acetobacterium paludosum]
MYDIAIIGAGIAGSYIARELSRYKLDIVLLDGENDVGNQITMANSAIVHAGFDAPSYKLKGKFNAAGNIMYGKICDDLDVPFKRCGSLVVAHDEFEMATIHDLYKNGLKNGVPGLKILFKDEVHAMEPNLSEDICGALYAPTAGIVSPFELCAHVAENAVDNGVTLKLNHMVTAINKVDDYFSITTADENIDAKLVINAAGLYADDVYEMVGEPYFKLLARKGNYFIFDKDAGSLVNSVIFPCPSKNGKGILVSPTVHGNLLIGPDASPVDKGDVSTTGEQLDYIKANALKNCPALPFKKIIRSYAGLRNTPVADTFTTTDGDFILEESPVKGFINVAGYESPGLTSIPAVAHYVVEEIVKPLIPNIESNPNFDPKVRPHLRFEELSDEERADIIKKDPKYGKVICRCETITEGEILDVIHRNAGARTVKSVKKRCRAGMGRCQGGFCSPRVVEILARELNCSLDEIMYDQQDSTYILAGQTKSAKEEA